jgi:hypothetical protein
MVSYEVSVGFVIVPIILWSETFNLSGIIEAQKSHVWLVNGFFLNPLLFPMWVIFFISALAETARAPFDLTEAESELVAGFQTEYSSMSFALFWLGEYGNVLLMCALNAVLFWGGWLPPLDIPILYDFLFTPGLTALFWFFSKILFFFFVFSWVKATVPRFRYDQLMRLGWKIFLPISLLWVFLVSGYLMVTRYNSDAETSVPSRVHLGQLRTVGATDVCFANTQDGHPAATPVFITRAKGNLEVGQTVSILKPASISGDIRITADHSAAFGGSAEGQGSHGKVGFSYFDVIYDGRPALVLWMPDREGRVRMWDCQPEYELERLKA